MKEQKQQTQFQFPFSLPEQDRLFLEMLVVDEDGVEAQAMLDKYGVEVSQGGSPLHVCQQWFRSIKDAEKHHCQNVIDLHSQGKSIAGMQTSVVHERKR